MKKNILLIGLGSIGKRHLQNLVALGHKNISIVTKSGKAKEGFEQFEFYATIGNACSNKDFDMIIIATPTSNHISDLLEALENNIKNIYLEKPISHSLNDINKVKEKLTLSGANLVVGYDLHFDPGLILMKKYIDTGQIGKVVSFISEVGQYLPDWRPGIDYRKSMSAHRAQGGGVMLDLVHEFDYINWLVGPVVSIGGRNDKISNLEIDTEDVSVNLIETASGALGTIHLDYLQCELSRSCKIIGDKGVVVWSYNNSTVKFMSHQDRAWITHDFSNYKRNDRFIDIMNAFMISCEGIGDSRLVGFKDAIKSIELVELSKKSNESNFMEKV
jgi:predicted dehydrogenase